MPKRLEVLGAAILMMVVALASPLAGEAVNTTDENIAILGYDPVAYFTVSEPQRGDPQFEHVWQEARWHFASAEHRDMFVAEPRRYAPRYGGFCAGAMALGWKAPIDPEAWVIIDDRLYLAFNTRGLEPYADDPEATIAEADANWERLGRTE